jgi:large subunit ribosomal protein L3
VLGDVAVQLGFVETKPKRLTQGQMGHLRRNNLPPLRYLREFRVKDGEADVAEGQQIKADVFNMGERVDVIGTSKGRGFARERAPGSIGAGTNPGRTIKGLRMSGRMGNERVTTENLEVVRVDAERNLIAVRGSIPGVNGGIVLIKPARPRRR